MKLTSRVLLVFALVSLPFGQATARYRHHGYHHGNYAHVYAGGGYYTAVSGHQVHRPMHASNRPASATARCRDDSWSFSESHLGTCSHHGGVASWL